MFAKGSLLSVKATYYFNIITGLFFYMRLIKPGFDKEKIKKWFGPVMIKIAFG